MTTLSNKGTFSQRRPVLAVIIIELLLLVAMFAAGAYAQMNQLDYTDPVLIAFIPIALVLMVYQTIRRKWAALGFESIRNIPSKNWIFYLPLVLVLGINCMNGFKSTSISSLLYFIGVTLLVGFVEETIYRGLILRTLLAKGVTAAVTTSSILFAVTHILNALSGQSLWDTILQIVYALLVGLVLALLIIMNNNILPLITFHFIHNLIQFISPSNSFWYGNIIVIAVIALHAIWLIVSLRKVPVQAAIAG
ncbi:CPBP family intramembrane glutamic endopeptidase [Paenibacillus sp. YPG26]|uniref:CPBP family intramembrane glutamic endopeptidase n=1 Tax=Paenibacillus sp. YPG26 TaxID=2878915 RepID=UPI00203E3CC1|nr:CPBP family intramembrane glutamic endopeptidase [Paenibacillus sp. YPG26]USB34155.1 CPBP family intramembrane metalloprotease [Paenibacillus sp. YPG26]